MPSIPQMPIRFGALIFRPEKDDWSPTRIRAILSDATRFSELDLKGNPVMKKFQDGKIVEMPKDTRLNDGDVSFINPNWSTILLLEEDNVEVKALVQKLKSVPRRSPEEVRYTEIKAITSKLACLNRTQWTNVLAALIGPSYANLMLDAIADRVLGKTLILRANSQG